MNGWYFARTDDRIPPAPAAYDSTAGQVRMQLVQRKQQSFYSGWVSGLRQKTKVRDLRANAQ